MAPTSTISPNLNFDPAIKVKVAWAGICGSDLAIYGDAPVPLDHRHPIMGETGPKTLGHGFSGYVTAVADDVTEGMSGLLCRHQTPIPSWSTA
jgi:threonine dehydrogenase-like Zn-dependent dehydrogenase